MVPFTCIFSSLIPSCTKNSGDIFSIIIFCVSSDTLNSYSLFPSSNSTDFPFGKVIFATIEINIADISGFLLARLLTILSITPGPYLLPNAFTNQLNNNTPDSPTTATPGKLIPKSDNPAAAVLVATSDWAKAVPINPIPI